MAAAALLPVARRPAATVMADVHERGSRKEEALWGLDRESAVRGEVEAADGGHAPELEKTRARWSCGARRGAPAFRGGLTRR